MTLRTFLRAFFHDEHDCKEYEILGCMTCGREKGHHSKPCFDQNWGRICGLCGYKV